MNPQSEPLRFLKGSLKEQHVRTQKCVPELRGEKLLESTRSVWLMLLCTTLEGPVGLDFVKYSCAVCGRGAEGRGPHLTYLAFTNELLSCVLRQAHPTAPRLGQS